MAIVKLTIPGQVNTSLQAKPKAVDSITANLDNGAWDIIYFVRIDPTTNKQVGDVYRLGKCVAISSDSNSYVLDIDVDEKAQVPGVNDFVFFGKENKINISGVRGYYAEVEMKNDSSESAKLFSVGAEMIPSSK